MIVKCAWCGKHVEENDLESNTQFEISHGICQSCRAHFFPDNPESSLSGFLNTLDSPVLVLDHDAEVLFANTVAAKIFGESPEKLGGMRSGDVLECAFAVLPGGCGQTEHCASCTIRRAITETSETGVSQGRIKAYLNREAEHGRIRIPLLISTEKVGDAILLRVDEIGTVVEDQPLA